jgi:hypothetical protein
MAGLHHLRQPGGINPAGTPSRDPLALGAVVK